MKKRSLKLFLASVIAVVMVITMMPNLNMVAYAAAVGPTGHCEYWSDGDDECVWECTGSNKRGCDWMCTEHWAGIRRSHSDIEEGSSCELLCGYTVEPKPWVKLEYKGHTIWYKDPASIGSAEGGLYGVSCGTHGKEYMFSNTDGHVVKSETCSHITDIDPNQAPPTPAPTPSSSNNNEPAKSEEPAKPEEPAKSEIEEREALEEGMSVEPVTVDMTQFSKADSAVVPGTTYNLSNFTTTKGIVKGINAAVVASNKSGSKTVTIYSGNPLCFNETIIKAIQNGKKDVVYYFTYNGHLYSVTVPASVDASKVLEKAGVAGPLYVGKQLGTTRLIK